MTSSDKETRKIGMYAVPTTSSSKTANTSPRGLSILARSLFRQMREQGYSSAQIIGLSSELLDLVSSDLRQTDTDELVDAAE